MKATAPEPLAGNYFIAAYPPFSVWDGSRVPALRDALNETAPVHSTLGIYAHLPFCHKKCDYCYYLSHVGQEPEVVDRYLNALNRELDLYARHPAVENREVTFAYFGGGTPSTLTAAQVDRLGRGLRARLRWNDVREITFECAPRSVRPDLLKSVRRIGVNRLSMGVQTFDDELLNANGRMHLEQDVVRAYERIRRVGFDVVNLDLMVGLIGETDEKWEETVRRVIALGPESVTIYQMEIPFNTKLYRDLQSGSLPAPPAGWDVKRARLDAGFRELESAGYTIVSGYAAVKDAVEHRFHYQQELWRGCDMLGLGVASFGYFEGVHYQNQVALDEYEAAVNRGTLPAKRAYLLTDRDRLVRELTLQLKLGRVEAEPFRAKFGIDLAVVFDEPLSRLQRQGMLTWNDSGVTLTRQGLLRVDRLLPEFWNPAWRNRRYT